MVKKAALILSLFLGMVAVTEAKTSFGSFGMSTVDTGDLDYVKTWNDNFIITDAELFKITTEQFSVTITSLSLSTASLQAEVDALSLSTVSLQLQVDTLDTSTQALESNKVDRAGDTMTGSLSVPELVVASTFTWEGSLYRGPPSTGTASDVLTMGSEGQLDWVAPSPASVNFASATFAGTTKTSSPCNTCVTGSTVVVTSQNYRICYAGAIAIGTSGQYKEGYLVDGTCPPGHTCSSTFNPSILTISDEIGTAGATNGSFCDILQTGSSASRSFCMLECNNAGTATFGGTTSAANSSEAKFWVESIP